MLFVSAAPSLLNFVHGTGGDATASQVKMQHASRNTQMTRGIYSFFFSSKRSIDALKSRILTILKDKISKSKGAPDNITEGRLRIW